MLGIPAALDRLALGTDPRQRERASQAFLVLSVYLAFAVVQHVEVLLGLIEPSDSWRLTAWNLVGGFGFYAIIRSGLNLRRAQDRALAMPQTLWAMAGIAWSYAITGPARGAVLLIMLVVMMYGVFSWTAAKARIMAGVALSLLGGVMAWKAATDPGRYDPRVEGLHFVFSGIVLAAAAGMAVQFGRLRAGLQAQRTQLADALERIRSLATRDELTGLLNRRAILERLGSELRERASAGPRLCVAMIDLDHFKRFNDSHGHAGGDRVLRHFAELARDAVRAGDVLARWGGEEFLLMMPGASVAQGLDTVERIRRRLAAHPLDDVQPGLVVRFSAGVSDCLRVDDLESAIERADGAMYRAKEQGRDRALAATCDSCEGCP